MNELSEMSLQEEAANQIALGYDYPVSLNRKVANSEIVNKNDRQIRSDIKEWKAQIKDAEKLILVRNGWKRADGFSNSKDFWETTLIDGRAVMISKEDALMITDKTPEVLKYRRDHD